MLYIDIYSSRYLELSDICDTDISTTANHLMITSRKYGRYANERTNYKYLMREAVDPSMTDQYDLETILHWDELVQYMKLYLLRVISSTPFYPAPYNGETFYILPELIEINNLGLLSIDSAPGFYIDGSEPSESFIQLPYIEIGGPISIVNNILKTSSTFKSSIQGKKYFSIVDYSNNEKFESYTEFIKLSFPNFVIEEDIIFIMFGVSIPAVKNDMDDFLDYILTNNFFRDVINIIMLTC